LRKLKQAQRLRESWIREDLAGLLSDGHPLWDGIEPITPRLAIAAEIAAFREAVAHKQSDECLLLILWNSMELGG